MLQNNIKGLEFSSVERCSQHKASSWERYFEGCRKGLLTINDKDGTGVDSWCVAQAGVCSQHESN
jgi:hypothetical protein